MVVLALVVILRVATMMVIVTWTIIPRGTIQETVDTLSPQANWGLRSVGHQWSLGNSPLAGLQIC